MTATVAFSVFYWPSDDCCCGFLKRKATSQKTSVPPYYRKCRRLGTYEVLDKGELSTGVELTKLYFIHERTDKKDTAAGAAQQIVRREGIGQGRRIEPRTLVGDADDQRFGCRLKRRGDALVRTVSIAMKYSVDGCFACCHGDAEDLIVIESGLLCHLLGGLFHTVHAVEGGI